MEGIESDSQRSSAGEFASLEDHRQRGDRGVRVFIEELEKKLYLRQRWQRVGIRKRIQKIIHDPHSADLLQDIVDYARGLGDSRMTLLTLAMFSREFVNSTQADEPSREKDLMAGKMLDGLAERLLETPTQ